MKGVLISLVFLWPAILHAQQQASQPAARNSYAVVVGISTYAAKGIPKLKYANRDAQVFAQFLQTSAGGLVPAANIRLLIDSTATMAAVYDAMSWLRESCGKDDLVYFYFAGHGDMESETIYKLGFLLTYNTPRTNYINNAIRIEDLNNFANSISIENKANVILITDACHSGQLAGKDFRGNFLVGDQLRTMRAKEIRITSCAKDELAMEDERWGGGRGVFSFYLINGLSGLADKQADGFVTLAEIRNYLDASFTSDPLLKEAKHKQTPVLQGSSQFPLAVVNAAGNGSPAPPMIASMSGPVVQISSGREPEDLLEDIFRSLESTYIESSMQFEKLNQLSPEQVPLKALAVLKELFYSDTLFGLTDLAKKNIANLRQFELAMAQNELLQKAFSRRLVILIHDRAQEVINLALAGDAAELERRRYYNAAISGYDVYPAMFSLALKLTDPEDYLYRVLQVNYFYFSGLAAQIKIPTVADPKPLLAEALQNTLKALELEKNAAYIYNQLGALQMQSSAYDEAEQNFLKAVEISPQWAVPLSNLIGLYLVKKRYDKASEAFETARSLQPDLQNSYANAGALYETQGDLLYAEELQRTSIRLNSRHYYPFERLGSIYMNTTKYALSDSFFYEADLRKQGYHFSETPTSVILPVTPFDLSEKLHCYVDTLQIPANDLLGNFAWGIHAYVMGNMQTAEQKFKRVIALDKSNPLAFHYLGKILFKQSRWQEGEIILNYALQYFLDSSAFTRYLDSVKSNMPASMYQDCIASIFKDASYPRNDNHYFLAKLYENWNHFAEAEEHYRILIEQQPDFIGPYHQLWTMLEKIGRYQDAEKVIQKFLVIDKVLAQNELNDFYRRMALRLPEDGSWHFKAGQFLYQLVAKNPGYYSNDLKTILPDETEPSLVSRRLAKPHGLTIHLNPLDSFITLAANITTPFSDGIRYLLLADTLLAKDEYAIADINDKIADLYLWQGLPEKAFAHYQKSVDLQPENSGTRLKLIECYAATWQFRHALAQLENLAAKKEINFSKQLLLAEYYIHAGRFQEAAPLLASAQEILPYKVVQITDLQARQQLLAKQHQAALKLYKEYLASMPQDAATMYSIARLYAKMNKQKEAWQWLQKSVDKGFVYSFVLKSDSYWDKFRADAPWKQLMQRPGFKTYPAPKTSVPDN